MVDEYFDKYGADPSPLLLTDWMSDLVSELEDADDVARSRHRSRIVQAAGMSVHGDTGRETIWEVVQPGFRSVSVSIQTSLCFTGSYIPSCRSIDQQGLQSTR